MCEQTLLRFHFILNKKIINNFSFLQLQRSLSFLVGWIYCVREMASNLKKAESSEEKALLKAAKEKDFKALTSLLENGVTPNVYDEVC